MPDLLDAVDAAPVQQPAAQPAAAPSLLDQIDQAPQQPASFGGAGSAVRDLAGGFAGVFKQDRKDADAGEAFDRDIKLRAYMQDQARQHARNGVDANAGFNQAMVPGVDRNAAWGHYQRARSAYDLAYGDVRNDPSAEASQRLNGRESPDDATLTKQAFDSARWDLVGRPTALREYNRDMRRPADSPASDGELANYFQVVKPTDARYLSQLQPGAGPVTRAYQSAVLGLAGSVPGTSDELRGGAALASEDFMKQWSGTGLPDWTGKLTLGAAHLAAQLGTGAGAGRLLGLGKAGQATAATATMIGSQASSDYREAREKGLDLPRAAGYAALNGLAMALTMRAGSAVGEALRSVVGGGEEIVKDGIMAGLKQLPGSLAKSAGEMNVMGFAQGFNRAMSGVDPLALRAENLLETIRDSTVNGVAFALAGHSGLIGSAAKRMLKDTQARADLELTNSRAARQLPAEPEAPPEAPQGPQTPSGQQPPPTAATPAEAPAAKPGPKTLAPRQKTEPPTPEAPNAASQGIGTVNDQSKHQGTQSPRQPAPQPEANRGDSAAPGGQGQEAPRAAEEVKAPQPLPPGKLNDKAKAMAGEHGIEASDLKEAAQHIAKLKNDEIKNRNAARAALSKSVGVAQNSLARLENKGQDYSSIKDLDVHAEPILREYGLAPEGDPHFDYAAAAADLLREGRQKQVEWHHASVLDSAVDLIKPKGNQPPPKGDAYEPEPYGDEDLLNHPIEGVPFAKANEPHPQLPGVASQSHRSDPREPLGSIPGKPAGRQPGPGQGTLPNVPLEPAGPNGSQPPPTGNDFQQRAPFNDPDQKVAAKAYAKQLADRADLGKALTTRAMAERDAGDKYIRSTLDDASRRLDTLDRAARRDFMWRYQTGGEQPTRELQGVADTIKTLSREFTDKVRGLGEGYLEHFNENWLKQLWKAKDGTPVGNIVAQLLGNKPLAGPGGFLRRKTWETQLEGIEAGGVPLTENPVEAQIKGLIEMNKFYTAHKLFQQFEANGVDKFVTAFDKAPPGMSPVNDRMFTKSGPRDLKVREAYDEGFATDLENFLRGQGVDTVKALTMGTGPRGGNVWGYWDRANDLIKTRFNAPASVLAHEAGHWAAERTNLLAELAKQMGIGRLGQATRRLAELRLGPNSSDAYRQYVHGPDERAAVILDAYLNARDRMADMTPELHDAVQNWVRRTPGMAELEKIRPTLILGQRENSIPIPGRVELGKHHVPTALAKRLDNIVSAGLGETIDKAIPAAAPLIKAGTAFSQVSNGILNNVELLSGFHTIGGTLTRMASRFNQAVQRGQYGIRDIWRSDVGGGLKKIGSAFGKGALSPTAPLGAFGEGAQIKRSIKQGIQTPETERIIEGGGRVGPNLELSHALKYRDAVREFKDSEDVLGKVDPAVRAIWNKGLHGLEFGQSHIMDAAMNLKLSAENEMMAEHERNNPNMSEQQRLEMRQRVNRLADSLYGQVVYDNWNVHKTLRQAGQLLVRALGWWHGTVHGLVYSPAKEIVTTRSRLARGENLIGDAMGHLLGVGLAGALMGGTYQKLKTGLWPQTPTDYFFPKTGLKRPDGSDDRLSIPGYPKSLVSLWQHPQDAIKNAESPVMNILSAYLSNRNYWGDPIYDENAPLTERAGQFGKYVGQEAQPFAVQGYKRQVAMGEHPLVAGVQSALGFTPASGAMTRSPAMQKALDYRPHTPQSLEEQTKAAQRRSLNQEAKDAPEGMKEHLAAKVESGAMTQQQADRMLKTANSEPLVSATRTLTHEQALEVWKLADDKERTPALKAALEAKLTNHLKKLEPAKVSDTVKEAKTAGLDGDSANRELIRSLAKAADQKLTLKSSQTTVDRQAAAEKRLRAIGPTAKDRAAADDENSYRKAVAKTQRRLGPRTIPAGR